MIISLAAAVAFVLLAGVLVWRQLPALRTALIGTEERVEAVRRLQARLEKLQPRIAEVQSKLPRSGD
ncbi:hypothetical protein [Stackebrandtia soli]|uniref:hypothetical protein n=1 Tax=Stackebrandtia soli TaxID=1892856 RepID=UPI0039EA01E2